MADSTTKDLDELYAMARGARRLLEPGWFLNLAFFQGEQWVAWNGHQLHRPQLAGNRITVVENVCTGIIRTELSKMTKNRPVFTVTPASGDEEAANAADLGEKVMRFMWGHLNLHDLTLKALEWSRITGAGFLKVFWDNTIGDPVDVLVGSTGEVITDPSGKPLKGDQNMAQQLAGQMQAQVTSKRIAAGDIKVEVRSPFQMFVDPMADTFEDAEWLIEESVKSLEYCKQRYGAAAEKLKADTSANPGLIEGRMMGNANTGSQYKGVKIREYWCKPCTTHPKGCRAVWSQGKFLYQDNAPFDPQPYVMLSGIPVPGRLWPISVMDLLRGPQTERNKVRSQMAENRNRVGNPTLLASKQAVQDPEKFQDATMVPGGVYYHDGTWGQDAQINYLEAPQLPAYVPEEVERIDAVIENISGQHEVTNANVPPGVTAASAITLLQEADDTRLGLAMQDYENQLSRFGKKTLKLVANFYTDSRTIKLGGEDGAWEIFDFKGAMLRGNCDVAVQAGSAFPQSKAAKQAMIQDWMTFFVQSGNAPHGRQLAQFLRDSGMGASDRLVQEYTADQNQANRENVLLMQGQALPINVYDNDEAHLENHEDFEKSAQFANANPMAKAVHLEHANLHRQRLAQIQQQQMQLQAQAQGQPAPQDVAAQQQQQMQGQAQQQDQQQQQADQQQLGTAQQQGYQAASQQQQQRQAQESHEQRLHHAQQAHEANLQRQREQHEARLQQMKQQANAPSQGARK